MKNINMHRINNVLNTNPIKNNSTQNKVNYARSVNFEDTLNEVQSKNIKFSKHAQIRMDKRNLTLNTSDMMKLEQAIGKAEKKGIRDALILMDNQAFIANVKNKTIVTTVSKDKLSENIFTNIDGAVII